MLLEQVNDQWQKKCILRSATKDNHEISGHVREEFMDKIYQVISYEKSYTRLTVTCRYPIRKEYIVLPITDQETMEIAFAVIEAPGNSVKLYISASEEYPSHDFSAPHAGAPMEREAGPSHNPYDEGGTPAVWDDDSDGANPVPNQSAST